MMSLIKIIVHNYFRVSILNQVIKGASKGLDSGNKGEATRQAHLPTLP